MFNIKDFRKAVDPRIWERGKNYFEDGAVTDLEDTGNGEWTAIVTGTDDYEVTVDIKFDQVQQWECDCPYEGDTCKHVVATILAIDEKKKTIPLEPNPKTKQAANSRTMNFSQLVNSVPLEELRQFIIQHSSENSEFKRDFKVYFAEKDPAGSKENYSKIIRQSFSSAIGRHGFLEYHQAPKAFRIVFDLIDKANEFLNHKNYSAPLQIALAIIEQVGEVAGSMDDSDGMVSETFDSAFDIISSLANNKEVPMPLKDRMFDLLKTEYPKSKYSYFGDDMILDSLTDLAEITGRMNDVFPLIDQKLKRVRSDFEFTRLLQKKIKLLKSSGRLVEVVQLIHENMNIPEIRRMKVDEYLEQKRYDEAERTIIEGISISKKEGHPGTTNTWKTALCKIYHDTKQNEKYISILRELFSESREEKKYYSLLKQAIGKNNWAEERDRIIDRLKKERYFNEFLYDLYVIEEMWDELIALMKQRFRYALLRHYHDNLFPRFPEDMLKMYTITCEKFAEQSNDRSNYKELASMLKQVQKLDGGRPVVTNLLSSFRNTYKRRPAMMEELSKLS